MAKRILIVEDEPDILKVTAFRLKSAGYEIFTVTDGAEAIEFLKKSCPDLIILDLILPVLSGYEVCRYIKSDAKLKDIPVILFTASTVESLEKKVKEMEADDYIIKPFEPEQLLEMVKRHIK